MSIDSIASLSTAMSQAQLQAAASVKIFKLAQGQSQVAADLLNDALENVAASIQLAADSGANIDVLA